MQLRRAGAWRRRAVTKARLVGQLCAQRRRRLLLLHLHLGVRGCDHVRRRRVAPACGAAALRKPQLPQLDAVILPARHVEQKRLPVVPRFAPRQLVLRHELALESAELLCTATRLGEVLHRRVELEPAVQCCGLLHALGSRPEQRHLLVVARRAICRLVDLFVALALVALLGQADDRDALTLVARVGSLSHRTALALPCKAHPSRCGRRDGLRTCRRWCRTSRGSGRYLDAHHHIATETQHIAHPERQRAWPSEAAARVRPQLRMLVEAGEKVAPVDAQQEEAGGSLSLRVFHWQQPL
eukprot:6958784-Prymnesium_polylepis.1